MAYGKQTCIVTSSDGTLKESRGLDVPQICSKDAVLVRVHCVSLNPSDHKIPKVVKRDGLVSGCDFAGEIVQVGAEANSLLQDSRKTWKVGDRVCGAVQGANPDRPGCGAFAEYVEADPVVLIRLAPNWEWSEGAALGGSCVGAIGMALFRDLQLDMRALGGEEAGLPKTDVSTHGTCHNISSSDLMKIVLVYGGSSASGTMAIQLLRLGGYFPITTCSPHNNSLATAYGATAVFEYNSDSCVHDIKKYTKGSLALVIDCIGTAQSSTFCYAVLGRAGGRYVALEKIPDSLSATRSRTVRASWVMGPLMFGRRIALGGNYDIDADPEARDFARRWYAVVETLVAEAKIKPHPAHVVESAGGWVEAVLSGLRLLRDKGVSGEKLVVKLGETNNSQ